MHALLLATAVLKANVREHDEFPHHLGLTGPRTHQAPCQPEIEGSSYTGAYLGTMRPSHQASLAGFLATQPYHNHVALMAAPQRHGLALQLLCRHSTPPPKA